MIPFILAAIGAEKAISAGINYFEQRKQGAADLKAGEMERDLFGKNADLAEQQAKDATARGEEAELRQRFRMRTLTGAQEAGFAGQGVAVGYGSSKQVIQSDQALGNADRMTILENARREAFGFRSQEDIYRRQGDMAYQAGKNRKSAADISSIGTLANFGGDMFNLYKMGK